MNYLISISYCWFLKKKLVITTNLTYRECAPDKSLVRQFLNRLSQAPVWSKRFFRLSINTIKKCSILLNPSGRAVFSIKFILFYHILLLYCKSVDASGFPWIKKFFKKRICYLVYHWIQFTGRAIDIRWKQNNRGG